MPSQNLNRISPTFHSLYDFQRTLMSMLTPADLTCFLAAIGYVMTKAERDRYMRLERQVFKDTALIDKFVKQGYGVVLVGPRLNRLWNIIRYRSQLRETADVARAEQTWRAQMTHTRDGFGAAMVDSVDKAVKVWLCRTHKDFLAKNKLGETVTRNPDIPVTLPE
ncbi:MAG: hypothetical protein MMC33_010851 [Icmadophila ericetorum]|nr:hypothetical protein [Icmadophila ericetorum]